MSGYTSMTGLGVAIRRWFKTTWLRVHTIEKRLLRPLNPRLFQTEGFCQCKYVCHKSCNQNHGFFLTQFRKDPVSIHEPRIIDPGHCGHLTRSKGRVPCLAPLLELYHASASRTPSLLCKLCKPVCRKVSHVQWLSSTENYQDIEILSTVHVSVLFTSTGRT